MCKKIKAGPEIVIAEYNYIAETAFQASEERAKVTQFFIISFGGFLTAILSFQFPIENVHDINQVFGILFLLIYIFGGVTVFQLARFRIAWIDSIRAMNQIKLAAIQENKGLGSYFRWTQNPKPFKAVSIGFSLVIMIALISGASVGSAVSLLGFASRGTSVPLRTSIIYGCLGGGVYITLYIFSVKGMIKKLD